MKGSQIRSKRVLPDGAIAASRPHCRGCCATGVAVSSWHIQSVTAVDQHVDLPSAAADSERLGKGRGGDHSNKSHW